MTVDELHAVLSDKLDVIQKGVDRINGKCDRHGDDITALKIRDGYIAGGLTIAAVFWESIRRKMGW